MKKILYFTLKLLSIAVIKKYQPKIIGITGSVGKTSSKEAIFSVIKKNWRVRRSIKNYNNEIGVPLTILNQDTGGKSIVAWIKIVIAGLKLLVFKNKKYPQIFIGTTKQTFYISSENTGHLAENTNLVANTLAGLQASKTGYTDQSGGSLAIRLNLGLKRPVVAVILGTEGREVRFSNIEKIIKIT